MVSYADLMTLLFALFAVLFARSFKAHMPGAPVARSSGAAVANPLTKPEARIANSVQAMQPVAIPQAVHTRESLEEAQIRTVAEETASLRSAIETGLANEIVKGEVTVRSGPAGLVVSLGELGFFRSGEARLRPEAAAKVDRIGRLLSRQGTDLRIEGYSDDQPIHNAAFHSNWELSTARAESVLELLVARSGVDPSRISVAGYGSYHPLASNGTSAGRGANRRVDLVVLQNPTSRPGAAARDSSRR